MSDKSIAIQEGLNVLKFVKVTDYADLPDDQKLFTPIGRNSAGSETGGYPMNKVEDLGYINVYLIKGQVLVSAINKD